MLLFKLRLGSCGGVGLLLIEKAHEIQFNFVIAQQL